MGKIARNFSAFLFITAMSWHASANAVVCAVPNQISNGQVADASKVMSNFNAIANCVDTKTPAGNANSIQINGGSGALSAVAPLTTGQILQGSTGAAPQGASLNAGYGITISNVPGSVTISSVGGGNGSDIVMALGAAWAKEMVTNGAAITAGMTRSVKADLGTYVGMRMIANTSSGFDNRAISTVNYTVPAGAVAFVVFSHLTNVQVDNTNFYRTRLFNVTKNRVAADPTYNVPSQSPGTATWALQYSGLLSTQTGGSASDVNDYYPLAGSAGDVLQLEAWTSGDGNYRVQDLAVYLVVVNATTGDPIS